MPNIEKLFPPERYELIPRVAVFKTHERHKGGRLVKVTKTELEKIAKNHNGQFARLGRAAPFSKGHTLDEGPDGADVPEEDQPDVVGYGVRFYVDKVPEEPNEDFLFCDLYLMKKDRDVLEQYPAISPEYYPSLNQLYPISFLKSSAPELSLPPVLHRYGVEVAEEDEPYSLTMKNPLTYTKEKDVMDKNEKVKCEADEKDKDVKDAQVKETKGAKEDGADLAALKDQVAEIMQFLPVLKELSQMLSAEGSEDDEGEEDEKAGKDKSKDKPEEADEDESKDPLVPLDAGAMKDQKVDDKKSPVKFDAGMASATNGYVPSNTKKENYKVDNDELLKYKAEVKAEMDALKAKSQEAIQLAETLQKKNRRVEAEKLVYELENKYNILFASPVIREEEIVALTELDPDSAKIYYERAKVRYQKKTPDAEGAKKAVKYSTENPDDIKSLPPEDAKKLADKIVASGLSYEQYFAKLAGKK